MFEFLLSVLVSFLVALGIPLSFCAPHLPLSKFQYPGHHIRELLVMVTLLIIWLLGGLLFSVVMIWVQALIFEGSGEVVLTHTDSDTEYLWMFVGLGYSLMVMAAFFRLVYNPNPVKRFEFWAFIKHKYAFIYLALASFSICLPLNWYIRVSPAGVHANNFLRFYEQTYDWQELTKVRVRLSGNIMSKTVEPQFDLFFSNDEDMSLWKRNGPFRTPPEKIRRLGELIASQGIPLEVDKESFYSASSWTTSWGYLAVTDTVRHLIKTSQDQARVLSPGETASSEHLQLKVLSVSNVNWPKKCKSSRRWGYRPIAVKIEIHNRGKSVQYPSRSYGWEIYGKRTERTAPLHLCTDNFDAIPVGGVRRGFLRYQVAQADQKFMLLMTSNLPKSGRVNWKFNLK